MTVASDDRNANVERASFDLRRKVCGVPPLTSKVCLTQRRAGYGCSISDFFPLVPVILMQPRSGTNLGLHIPKLPLYVSPPRAEGSVLQQVAAPRALPISRSLSSAQTSDSRKSARATPMTRTLLVWGTKDGKRRNSQVHVRAAEWQ